VSTTFNSTSLVSRALAALVSRINSGTYTGNLPPQDTLAADLKVSRTVIREAVVILRFCNVLTVRPKTGTRINEPSKWIVAPEWLLEQCEEKREETVSA
jgi:DNA-binding FadR family transcriptional regulator